MFSRNSKSIDQSASERAKSSVPSIISSDLTVSGDIISGGEVQIDGEVIGDIKSKVLLVGETAKIKGEIYADTIRIHGSINGQIKAKTVHLAKTAHVIGDVLHENLSIDEGAYIEGHITRMTETITPVTEDRVNLVMNKGQAQGKVPESENDSSSATKPDAKKVAAGK